MNQDWESKFAAWGKSPADTEEKRCENAIKSIRNAIANSQALKKRNVKVFAQGSYRNNVNVRQDSDVDVGVICHDNFLTHYPPGKTDADFGNYNSDYSYLQFKDDIEVALVKHFGRDAVHRGNKAFDIRENSYHVEADVAPLIEYRHYYESGSWITGVALISDNGDRIVNYPERLLESWPQIPQHYENGVSKNSSTGRRFKSIVRIVKALRNEMEEAGIVAANSIPGFLIECMVWNVPNSCFEHSAWDTIMQATLCHIWSSTKDDNDCKDWTEVNDIKYLFRNSQSWTLKQAHTFIDEAWSYVGVR